MTSYRTTNQAIISILEKARQDRNIRLRIYYGDTNTGVAWGDRESGYVGRSMGPVQIPILLSKINSIGGGGILDHCIVRIEQKQRKDKHYQEVYRHQTYEEKDAPARL